MFLETRLINQVGITMVCPPTRIACHIFPHGFYFGPLGKSLRVDQSTVFAGKDASRALACSSLKPEDCRPEWQDLGDKEKGVLEEWFAFFSKRYNIVGKVEGASNL